MLTNQDIPRFDPKIYTRIALNELLIYAVYFLSQSGTEITAEDVELVTNSNDSYHRLEDTHLLVDGQIVVEISRRHNDSIVRVCDYAEGMNAEQMDQNVGVYGAPTSGFVEGRSVRGMWGRGLKDAFYGLGHGHVYSIRDGMFNHCSLSIKGSVPTYDRDEPRRATRPIRKQFNIPSDNGTVMEIIVSRAEVHVPQFDNMRRGLERHFELRAIMSNPQRRVLLRELDRRGKVKQEVELAYKPPVGVEVLNEFIDIPGSPAKAHLEVYRSDVPLSTPGKKANTQTAAYL